MSQGIQYPLPKHVLDLLLRANTNNEHNIVKFRIKLPDENRWVELFIDGLTHKAPDELTINMKAMPE